MEKYERPVMEIVDLENEVILTSGCDSTDPNEGPFAACSGIDF